MTSSKLSKEKLLNKIQSVCFALYDTQLYLNTHPEDAKGLEKFDEYNRERRKLINEYTELYGDINTDYIDANNGYWTWISAPWPWQEG